MISKIKDGVFYFDGCNTIELAREYGTPLYVYSETNIVDRINELKRDFINKYPDTRVAYAAKAFGTMAIFKLIQREGLSIDVVSGGELYTAIKAEFPPERIEFNGNNKLRDEIEMALDYGIGRIIVDGLQELSLIEKICAEKNKKVNILYRITPGVISDSHDYIVTGKKDSKFGIPLDDVFLPAVQAAIDSDVVNFMGFHFHVGSQLLDNSSHLQAVDILLSLVGRVREELGYDVTELNIGGGFGIKYTTEERKSFSYFIDPIMNKIDEFYNTKNLKRPSVVIEPGRSIVGESGITLYTIGSIKDIKGVRKYVSVDGGMTDNIRPALYQAEYHGIVANKADSLATDKVTICGKCCESGDILIKDLMIPLVVSGDTLAVLSTGAYGYSMASNYNKNPIPAIVLVKDGDASLIVKRQSYKDMIANELIPSSLL